MDTTQNHVVLVNQHDQDLGMAHKIEAHQYGWLHRAFSIFIFRHTDQGLQTLLQQRHPKKYHCGNLWTNACCSHPPLGYPLLQSAQSRLKVEMNIETDLTHQGYFIYQATCKGGLIEHELDHVFTGFFDQETMAFHPDEVIATKWVNVSDLPKQIEHHPNLYTPWIAPALQIALSRIDMA